MANEIELFARNIRALITGLSGAGGPGGGECGGAGGGDYVPPQFPPGGMDFIKHDLRINLSAEKARFSEVVLMTGAMTIQRTDPYINREKRRQIDFKVLSWSASGWSERLGVAITYVLTPDKDQPISTIVAEQEGYDFPASFNFRVIFDALVNNELVFRALEGRPEGHGFREVPPSGNRRLSPTITRFADLGVVSLPHPEWGELVIKPIDCNDQEGETLREMPGTALIKPLGLGGGGPGRGRGGRGKR